jgi:STE24 endopeptidase
VAFVLIMARWIAELFLSQLNRQHVRTHAKQVPAALREVMDDATYSQSVSYTLARNRFSQFSDTYGTLVLLAVLFSGVLPWSYELTQQLLGASSWSMALFLFVAGLGMTLPGLPLDWIEQFRLEQRFGFNTTTQRTWWLDRMKSLLLAIVLGYPLLGLLLSIAEVAGARWWLYAWSSFLGFQLLMTVLAPVLILPWFNKLTPLPEGALKNRLTALARRTQFVAGDIQVMDGSRRSRHSNAFFTGFGRLRKIVLFDTLITQLNEAELEAVLAHEIGHYRLKHIPKMLTASALGSLAGFYAIAWLASGPGVAQAFGFVPPEASTPLTAISLTPVLLLFALLAGTLTFWLSPLFHWLSRRYEYEADAFAKEVLSSAQPLIGVLRKLNEKNLGNLTPHPVYSGFYYSHPTLLEREAALSR